MKPTLSYLITRFFVSYLANERGASKNTIAAYSDTLRLLIKHLCKKHSKQPEELGMEMLDPEAILDFLDHLERERNNSQSTRNQRLAAIKSFLHYAARENPELMLPNERIQAIRSKKTDHKPPPSLTIEQVHSILDSIDTTLRIGLRDKALIQLLYNTGARVQEIADLSIGDLRFESPATVTLTGKGRKTRTVPLWKETVQHIQAYLQAREHAGIQSSPPLPQQQKRTHHPLWNRTTHRTPRQKRRRKIPKSKRPETHTARLSAHHRATPHRNRKRHHHRQRMARTRRPQNHKPIH